VRLDFPPQARQAATDLVMKIETPANPYLDDGRFRWLTLDVTARDARNLERGHLRFDHPVTLTFDLTGFPAWRTPYLVHQVNAAGADAGGDRWEPLPAQYDPETQQLTAQVAEFSAVGLEGAAKFPEDGTHYLLTNLPDVSAFTGAATYAYDLKPPAGRAGLGPNLSLSYNSAAFNGLMGSVQSGYVGAGWSLGEMAAIVRPIKSRQQQIGGASSVWEFTNDFTLQLGGASYRLVGPDKIGETGGCRYYAEDAPQLRVMRYTAPGGSNQYCGYGPFVSETVPNVSKEYWVVTTADGVQYRLGFDVNAEQVSYMHMYNPAQCTLTSGPNGVCSGQYCIFAGYAGEALEHVAYRWSVDRIRDVSNNAVFFGYQKEQRSAVINGVTVVWDRAQYPDWIRYTGIFTDTPTAAGIYLVDFGYEARRNGSGGLHDAGLQEETYLQGERPWAMWDELRMQRIRICKSAGGTTCPNDSTLIAEYVLGYELVREPWPGLEWILNTIDHDTTRLARITRYGRNAVGQMVALPPATFTYATYNQGDDSVDPTGGGNVGGKLVYPRLVAASNGYGGQTTFTYEMLNYNHALSWRVTQKTVSDGLGHTARLAYTYTGECFSGVPSVPSCRRTDVEKEGTCALIGHQTTTVAAYDYNGAFLSRTRSTFITDANVNRGKPLQTAAYDAASQLLQQQTNTWSLQTFGWGTFTAPVGYLTRVVNADYSGGAAVTHQVDYAYDAWGNQKTVYDYGDGGDAIDGDEKTLHRVYYPNTPAWIVNRPARETLYAGIRPDDDNPTYLKSRTRYRYDNQGCWDLAPIDKGRLTAVDRWAGARGGNTADCQRANFDITTYAYDTWGNQTQTTDPLGNTTVTTYDTLYHQFPIQTCPPLSGLCTTTNYYGVNEETSISGDFGLFGQVQRTYANYDQATRTIYSYDAFGRLLMEVSPGDNFSPPTRRYVYHDLLGALPPVVNAGFENRVSSPTWAESDTSNNVQAYAQDATQAYAGSNSLRISVTGSDEHYVYQDLSGGQAGRTYQIYAYVKTTTANPTEQLCLSASGMAGHETPRDCRTATGTWELLISSVTLPVGANRFRLILRTPQMGTVYVDEVTVTELYQVSAYAKEDTAGNTLWNRQVFDGLGRVIQTQAEFNGAITSVVDQRYNAAGQVVLQSVPYSRTGSVNGPWYVSPSPTAAKTTTQYDALGRPTQVIATDSSVSRFDYYGRQTAARDAKNNLKISVVDAYGQLTAVREYNTTYSSALNWGNLENTYYARTRYTYDAAGNLVTVTDNAGNVTTLTYDNLGRKTKMIDPDMGTWYYYYDNNGNLVAQVDAKKQATNFYYDVLNRLKGKTYATTTTPAAYTRPADPGSYTSAYTYDAGTYGKGQRTGMNDATSGYTNWTYDARGRVTEERKIIYGTNGGTFVTQWSYDPLDRVTAMRYPQNNNGGIGEQVNTTYTPQGQVNGVAGTSTYVISSAYDNAGRLTRRNYGNTLTTAYGYHYWITPTGQGRLQSLTTGTTSDAASLQSLAYTYDAVGNVATISDYKAVGTLQRPQIQSFGYDTLNRMITATVAGGGDGMYGLQTYTYDQIGNLTRINAGNIITSYTYPPSGANSSQPHAAIGMRNNTYGYDANGNQITRIITDSFHLTYDAENRLTTIRGVANVDFTYDGDGNRIRQTPRQNLAKGRTPTVASGVTLNQPQAATDGDTWADSGSGGSGEFAYTSINGLQYIQIDLGAVYSVDTVMVWHYAGDGRTYHNTKTQVSADGSTWYTVFDSAAAGEYAETAQGKTHQFAARSVRYVRDYTNGSTANAGNHWVEIIVLKTPANESTVYIGNTFEWTGSAATMVKYYYAGGQRVAMRKGTANPTYLFGDHLGSTAITANSNGALASEQRYFPWGGTRYGSSPTAFQYTGQRNDSAIGLYYYGARYYDPALARFIQADTITQKREEP